MQGGVVPVETETGHTHTRQQQAHRQTSDKEDTHSNRGELYSYRFWLARRGSTYPTLFFGSDASRAGTGRPGTLVCRRCGAFRCCVLC